MNGLGTLTRLRLRRDRLTLAAWAAGMGLLVFVSVAGVGGAFDEQARRELVMLMNANGALLFLRGGPIGTSLGAMIFATLASYLVVLVMIMGTFLGVRHTRGDEGAGRLELVGATAIDRAAPAAATLIAGVVAQLVVAAVIAGSFIATGLSVSGSLLLSAALLLAGMVGVALGMATSLVFATSRAANGAAAALVGAMFVMRGLGDALGTPSGDLTRLTPAGLIWASPIGWATQTRAFASDGWQLQVWPLLPLMALVIVLSVVLLVVSSRRDLDAALLGDRRGRASARGPLGTPFGLLLRLQRGVLIGWAVTALVLGLLVSRIAPAIESAIGDNPTIAAIMERLAQSNDGADTISLMLVAIGGLLGVLACAAGLQSMGRMRAEEAARGELLIATPIARWRWPVAALAVGFVAGALTLAAFALSAGVALAFAGEERWEVLGRFTLGFAPVLLVFLALGAVLFGVAPAALGALGWALLLGLMLGGEFGPLLGDSFEWVANISPFHWVPSPLDASADWMPALFMTLAALGGMVGGVAAFARRDVRVE